MLAQAAQSRSLPQPLRQSVAMMTWFGRVLKNEAVARRCFTASRRASPAGWSGVVPAQLTILRNPPAPLFDQGAKKLFLRLCRKLEDNWWCSNWKSEYSDGAKSLALHLSHSSQLRRGQPAGGTRNCSLLGAQMNSRYAGDRLRTPTLTISGFREPVLTLRMSRYGCYHATRRKAGEIRPQRSLNKWWS